MWLHAEEIWPLRNELIRRGLMLPSRPQQPQDELNASAAAFSPAVTRRLLDLPCPSSSAGASLLEGCFIKARGK